VNRSNSPRRVARTTATRPAATRPTATRRAVLAGAAALAPLAAGCQLGAGRPGGGSDDSAVPPRKGGTLTWAQWDANTDIDPATSSGASATEVLNNVLDTLVAMDADQKIYPLLAAKWWSENEGRKHTFTLRDDVKFHDGSTLNAGAVKRTLERILDPATKAAGVVPLMGPIDKIDSPDAKTVVVSFKEPYPNFLQNMWRPYFGILSPKQLDSLKPGDKVTAPVGSGPFKFANRSADGVITLEAFPDYAWGPETLKNRKAPYLQQIKFRTVTEAATRVATLESGEYLLIDELSEPDYARLKNDKRFRFADTPRRGLSLGFHVNVQKAPMDDKAVREAMNWAVDRKSIVERLFFGVHKVAVGPLSEGVWARLDELEKRFTFDPAKAKQVLDAGGWKPGAGGIREKGGQRLSVVLATFRSPWTEMAEAIQSQMRDVGIDLQVQKMERGPYLDFVRAYNHHLCASAGTDIDPDQLRIRFHSSNIKVSNFANLADPQLDALLVKGSQQVAGSAERRKTYEDAQRRLMDLLPFVSIMSQVRVEAMSSKVHSLKMGPEGLNALPLTDVWLDP